MAWDVEAKIREGAVNYRNYSILTSSHLVLTHETGLRGSDFLHDGYGDVVLVIGFQFVQELQVSQQFDRWTPVVLHHLAYNLI